MNKKVIKTMIALVIIFLTGLYVLKIFFPEQFVLSIENERLIAIGNYIDNHKWLAMIFGFILGCSTDYLYFGAVTRRKWIGIKLLLIILIYNMVFVLCYNLISPDIIANYATLISAISSCYMILTPMFFTHRIKELSITYSVNFIAQSLSLNIRNLGVLLVNTNSLIMFIFSIESYLWLLLLFLYFNFKKEVATWDTLNHSTEKTLNETPKKSTRLIERLRNLKTKRKSMSKELKKQKRHHLLTKIRVTIRDFILDELWIYLIVIGSIALCSWIFNKWIEGLMFCIAHIVIRRVFNKQFHFNSTAYCLMLTLAIAWFAIPITPSITVSLLSSIPIAFLVCFFGFLAQDRVDLLIEVKKLNKYANELLDKLQHKDIYSMDENELYEHCRSCGLSEDDCKIAYFVVIERLKGKELYKAIGYSERQTIRKRKDILDTIK